MSLSPFLSLLVFLFRMFLIICRSSFPPVINASCSCGCYGSSVWRGSLRKHPVSFLSHGASRDKKSTCPGCSCATRGTAAPCSTKSRRGRKTSSSDLCSAHHVIRHEESQHNRDSESSLHGSQNPALKLHRRTSHSCAMALDRPPKLTSPVQSAVFTIPNISKSPDGKQESNYHGTFSAKAGARDTGVYYVERHSSTSTCCFSTFQEIPNYDVTTDHASNICFFRSSAQTRN